jgi:hypothetical protein
MTECSLFLEPAKEGQQPTPQDHTLEKPHGC